MIKTAFVIHFPFRFFADKSFRSYISLRGRCLLLGVTLHLPSTVATAGRPQGSPMFAQAEGPGYLTCNLSPTITQPIFLQVGSQAVAATQHNTTHTHWYTPRPVAIGRPRCHVEKT